MKTLDQKIRVARKSHKCCFCGTEIKIGEKYDWQKNVSDRHLYEWKTHLLCTEIACQLKMYDDCDDEVTEDCFTERINDEYNNNWDDNPPFLEKLNKVKQKYGII